MKMKVSEYLTFFTFLLFLTTDLLGQSSKQYATMSEGFQNPPPSAQPIVYHWWLGGFVDTVRLKQELQSFKDMGISGLTIFEIGSRDTVMVKSGPAYLGPESLQIIKYAVEEAGKLGLEVGLNTASSWNAGGNWIPPHYAAKSIYYSTTSINGSGKKKLKLPFPDIPKIDAWGKPGFIEFDDDGK
ncbi:MAG: glycosyl hydrolase, partial [Candidatus Cyclobacteriaceae bacterium M3_2C_046]